MKLKALSPISRRIAFIWGSKICVLKRMREEESGTKYDLISETAKKIENILGRPSAFGSIYFRRRNPRRFWELDGTCTQVPRSIAYPWHWKWFLFGSANYVILLHFLKYFAVTISGYLHSKSITILKNPKRYWKVKVLNFSVRWRLPLRLRSRFL